jgi:hypothetical protein
MQRFESRTEADRARNAVIGRDFAHRAWSPRAVPNNTWSCSPVRLLSQSWGDWNLGRSLELSGTSPRSVVLRFENLNIHSSSLGASGTALHMGERGTVGDNQFVNWVISQHRPFVTHGINRAMNSDVTSHLTQPSVGLDNNATLDPLRRFGNTPTGTYVVKQIISTGPGTNYDADKYGSKWSNSAGACERRCIRCAGKWAHWALHPRRPRQRHREACADERVHSSCKR